MPRGQRLRLLEDCQRRKEASVEVLQSVTKPIKFIAKYGLSVLKDYGSQLSLRSTGQDG